MGPCDPIIVSVLMYMSEIWTWNGGLRLRIQVVEMSYGLNKMDEEINTVYG